MITTSKSIPYAATVTDSREGSREGSRGLEGDARGVKFSHAFPANSHHVYKVNRVIQNRKSRKSRN